MNLFKLSIDIYISLLRQNKTSKYSKEKINDFHAGNDGEAGKKAEGAPNGGEDVLELCSLIFGDLVECRSVRVDPDHVELLLVLIV